MFRTHDSRRGAAGSALVVVLVLAVLGAGLWYFVLRSTPKKTVTNLLEATRLGDEQMASDYLLEPTTAGESLVMGLTRRLVGDATGEPQYTVQEPDITEDRAIVPVQFPVEGTFRTLTGMESLTIPYVLHRQGRTWLVDVTETKEEIGREIAGGAMEMLQRFLSPGGAPEGAVPGERRI
jgi:hypothetical protein